MRTFYLFNIDEYYSSMYYSNSMRLYKILENLFYMRNYDKFGSFKLYKQIVIPFNKMLFNGYITKKNRLDYEYFYEHQTHYMKKHNEHTKMIIGSIHIRLISDINYPSFLTDINQLEKNIFVCDFDNCDYFWLNKVVKKYGQKKISIVE